MAVRLNQIDRWIFVTGVIRSGTTFLGKMLSRPLHVDYIHEPFHGGYTLPDRRVLLPRYVRPGDESDEIQRYRKQVAHLYRYDIAMRTALHPQDAWYRKIVKHIAGSRGPFYLRLAKLNPFHRAAVIKDPIGKLVTGFLYREFNTTPVIIVRHPVSLAASLERLGWWPEVREFAVQDDLVEDFFADEPDFLFRSWPNRMLESMAHWRATYKVLLQQAEEHSDWQVITHEALSEQPIAVLQTLYGNLGLPWSPAIARRLRTLTSASNSATARPGRVQDFKRDSARIFRLRRDAVPVEQRRQIFEIVKDVALDLYSRESFALDGT
jgi:hypothetical protein